MVMTGRARSGAPPELDVPGMSLVLPPPGAAARAPAGALHGRHAAFAAPARSTTDVTAGYASVKRPGRQVFQDEANAII
jgi:hypothetical protein